jgi:acyl-CoA synthetase (AMP-forming)/AMP-acid ligase II
MYRFVDLPSMLRDHLPHYMIPSIYIPVSSLPTNTNGKLDRKRLREIANQLDAYEVSLETPINGTRL